MSKPVVVIVKGLPASGKSTWCYEQIEKHQGQYKKVSKDDLRAMLDKGKHSKHRENFVCEARNALILSAIKNGYSILVDDTNLLPRHEQDIRTIVGDLATIELKDFTHVDVETCIERDRKRSNYVGEQVIRRMYRDFLQPKPQVVVYDPTLPDAIICDLDGTLALMDGRNPFDASLCENDILNTPVADIVMMHDNDACHILLVSGRQECHRPQTERWLAKHDIPHDALWMRPTGDSRKDTIIKEEIYEREIRGRFNIKAIFDDRDQVVSLWRSLGLTCLQVAYGDF